MSTDDRPLAVYAGEELGAYGWEEKPWLLPGERLAAVLAAIERRGLGSRLRFVDGPPATDEDLRLFHDAEYVAGMPARCAKNEGSLDRHVQPLIEDATRFLAALRDAGGEAAAAPISDAVASTFVPTMSFDTYVTYLGNEGLLEAEGRAAASHRRRSGLPRERRALARRPHLRAPARRGRGALGGRRRRRRHAAHPRR